MNKPLIFVIFVLSCFSSNVIGQLDSNMKSKHIIIGVDLYEGFDQFKEIISFKPYSDNILMKKVIIPKIGFQYKINNRIRSSVELGYGFISSSKMDTLIHSQNIKYIIKTKDVKLNLNIDYVFYSNMSSSFSVFGGISMNSLKETIEIEEEKIDKYSAVGYKFGLHYMYNFRYSGMLHYCRIGKNNLLGIGINIPIFGF